MSFDNSEIENALKSKGVRMVNLLKYSLARDPDRKLTNFKTGDRFVDIVIPDELICWHIYSILVPQGAETIGTGNRMRQLHDEGTRPKRLSHIMLVIKKGTQNVNQCRCHLPLRSMKMELQIVLKVRVKIRGRKWIKETNAE